MELPFELDLSKKVAVVTGGAGVLCSTFSEALAEAGASVAILDINLEGAEKVAAKITKAGGTALVIKTNILEKESLEEARKTVREKLGSCDILINGAGGNHPSGTTTKDYLEPADLEGVEEDITTFFDLDAGGIQFVFNLNFLGALLTSQVFSQDMAKKENSTIINVSSMNAFTPLTRIPAYSGAKAAVSNFTQWLAVHLSKVGVRVNALAPGFFETEQNQALLRDEDGDYSARAKKILGQTPMDRFGEAEELLGTLFWLVSPKASGFVTGTVIPIDGGFSAYSGV
ncbi:SDR family oxidoreductase [Halanaerobium hydrogeniformans]|uniref:Short-chain dehydrogenase/reductase SDR n=1 Tax=Halanaerobium hydrogeniformans TaxID=656519 RepID=E4RL89_HALHG|nr:SDR family oxidoreductase [Halanaerobium hydrogeniformans]ADQ15770.1 short-chain dehydrogenase/reductase SDR [Halanaerobium hydrogeniformans]